MIKDFGILRPYLSFLCHDHRKVVKPLEAVDLALGLLQEKCYPWVLGLSWSAVLPTFHFEVFRPAIDSRLLQASGQS